MKRRERETYKAMFIGGGAYLAKNCDTLKDMRDEIDRSNERAVARGYKAGQYIIIHEEWYGWFSDGGTFMKSETYESAIETYPSVDITN